MFLEVKKRGQLAIFVIIALVIAGAIIGYFLFKGSFGINNVNPELRGVFDYYTQCIKQETERALSIAGTQGGKVYVEDYAPGSEYAPFSSELNFLGFPVPYWYYVSGNGIIKENVPSKTGIEREVGRYVEENLGRCDFSNFYEQGFEIDLGNPSVNVKINDLSVDITVRSDLSVSKGEVSSRRTEHSVNIESKFGKFYGIAKNLYDKELEDSFLENYAVDVLRLYAPVDGVEIQCSPKIWKTREVIQELKQGLEANIGAVKFEGNYYSLNDEENKYFVVNQKVDENVNLIYSPDWPTRIEVYGEGVDSEIMVAEPIGNQEGLGIIGFCYIPYHFVYDLSFPVMFQITSGTEVFQFPVAVVVDKNLARNSIFSQFGEEPEVDVCKYKTSELSVNLYNINLNRVDANLSYICFSQQCSLGESKNGKFEGQAPTCLNGYLLARGEGYADKKELVSTNEENQIDLILDREYDIEVKINLDGKPINDNAMAVFTKDDGKSKSVFLPDVSKIKLSEGNYKIKVYVYSNSSINIPESRKTQCTDVPRSGILGIFGATKEQCVDIIIPGTKIDQVLIGGGQSEEFLLESEISKGKMDIFVSSIDKPKTIEELQNGYAIFEAQGLGVGFP